MGKLSTFSPSVNSPSSSLSCRQRRQVESQALCPWCRSPMYLNRRGDRLLCVDVAQCAGVMPIDELLDLVVGQDFHSFKEQGVM